MVEIDEESASCNKPPCGKCNRPCCAWNEHFWVVSLSLVCIAIFAAGFTYGMIRISEIPTWAPVGPPTPRPSWSTTMMPTCAPILQLIGSRHKHLYQYFTLIQNNLRGIV